MASLCQSDKENRTPYISINKFMQNPKRTQTQYGVTMIEYLIGLGVFALSLLTPIPPSNKSVFTMLEEAIKKEHSAYMYATSLPRVSDDGSLVSFKKEKKE